VNNYINQDQVVLATILLAIVVLAAWWLVKKFQFDWLNKIYASQMVAIYLIVLWYFSAGASR
jgi:hypothetical protein